MKVINSIFSLTLLLLALAAPVSAAPAPHEGGEQPWRIRFLDAAIVQGDMVRLGEVAVPVGDMPLGLWESISVREIWPAPSEGGRAVNMTRPRIQEAVMRGMKDLAPYCLFPGSLALQRGGALIGREAVQRMVESQLAPLLAALPGEAQLKDYRLPHHVFLEHPGQELSLETPRKADPGRLSLRFVVREMDGSTRQKLTGTVFVDCWAEVPCAATGMNKDDLLEHAKVTFKRMNLATLRGAPWDGRGGPWRLVRPVSIDQVIYQSDVAHIPTVRKGSKVTLLYEGKNVRLTVLAEALADGAAGENIPVRNMQSRREIFGMVRDSSTVIVATMP